MYFAVLNDVDNDWEMGICQNHLEFVTVGNTVNHVSDGASDSTENCVSFLFLKPHSEFDGWISFFVLILDHFEGNVLKSFCKGTELALDSN
jgi:hypothetical protein